MKVDWCISFLSLKIRQLAGKLRAFKEDANLWETCHKRLSIYEAEKFVSLLNILEIESKGETKPVLPVEHKKEKSENTWGQIVLWSPPKEGNNLPTLAVAVNFEEAGAYKTWYIVLALVFPMLVFHFCFSDFVRWTSHRFFKALVAFWNWRWSMHVLQHQLHLQHFQFLQKRKATAAPLRLLKSPRRKKWRLLRRKSNAMRSGGSQTFKKILCKTFGTRMWQSVWTWPPNASRLAFTTRSTRQADLVPRRPMRRPCSLPWGKVSEWVWCTV